MSLRRELEQAELDSIKLYNDLLALPAKSDTFYHVDQVGYDDATYRIFLYRLASYSDWLHAGGMEARGIMFRLNETGALQELVSRPMEKFFNWNENPFTMNIDLTQIQYGMVKEDGSLISSYTGADDKVYLKTKGSLKSEQAVAAMAWMYDPEQSEFLKTVTNLEDSGWTVNMEWTSPLNRIVVPYQDDRLIILNVRHRLFGHYMNREYMEQQFNDYLVPISDLMVEDVATAVGTEGIVAFFGNEAIPRFMKVKADAYLVLHRLKDGVNQPNALFEAVVHEQIDDLRASFAADEAVQLMIQVMEDLVSTTYHEFVKAIDELYSRFHHLNRKEFAVAMLEATKSRIPLDATSAFNVAMNRYLGRDLNTIGAFIRSAQSRVVAQYKETVVKALKDQNINSGNLELQ